MDIFDGIRDVRFTLGFRRVYRTLISDDGVDSRKRLILLAFVATYVVIVGNLFFLLPHVGSQTVVEILCVWIMFIAVVLIIASRIRLKTTTNPRRKPSAGA